MMVGIRELKSRLSEYLDRASKGEIITITERGRPKALLTGIPGHDNFEQGVAEGWITPANRSGLSPARPQRSERTIAEVLDEDRSE